jgi:hypothetical protein
MIYILFIIMMLYEQVSSTRPEPVKNFLCETAIFADVRPSVEVEKFSPDDYAYIMIQKAMLLLLLMVMAWVPLGECKDAGFRCANTFVDIGDSRARVLFKCGEPVRREVIEYINSRENGDLIEYVMEAWTYDSGPARFHIIIFKGNRVYNIESEMK